MKYILLMTCMLSVAFLRADENGERDTVFELTCFNGKIYCQSKCSMTVRLNKEMENPDGSLTCGYPGRVSKVSWEWKKGDGAVLVFTRVFPADSDQPGVFRKEVTYEGRQIVLFEDEHQVIVINPVNAEIAQLH